MPKWLVQWTIRGPAKLGTSMARTTDPEMPISGPFFMIGDEVDADLTEVADLVSTVYGGNCKDPGPLVPIV